LNKSVEYFFSPMSPWTYLGHARLAEICRFHGAAIDVKPVDYGRIFPVSGGLPLAKRAPQRQKYRLVELERWRKFLNVPLVLQPRFFPYDTTLASCMILAARETGKEAFALAGAILKACWAEERNMADDAELISIAKHAGLDGSSLLTKARHPDIRREYDRLTEEAIAKDVFGAPTYIYRGELFWGQDRLDFLERALRV
jgi:2-hydroxychromene-2-carboxylate isomerase